MTLSTSTSVKTNDWAQKLQNTDVYVPSFHERKLENVLKARAIHTSVISSAHMTCAPTRALHAVCACCYSSSSSRPVSISQTGFCLFQSMFVFDAELCTNRSACDLIKVMMKPSPWFTLWLLWNVWRLSGKCGYLVFIYFISIIYSAFKRQNLNTQQKPEPQKNQTEKALLRNSWFKYSGVMRLISCRWGVKPGEESWLINRKDEKQLYRSRHPSETECFFWHTNLTIIRNQYNENLHWSVWVLISCM